ncbi:MAG: hypothetical protein M0P20_01835 [Methanocorpusculum sp.]|nr:hypothetical protein [Methanocorpusculum sp.]MDD3270942.1 hypothetical protein [Syntrophomonadaceae bacterium]MDD4562233.1 hypothetical protein [Syntrophomonadaceae bacterium]
MQNPKHYLVLLLVMLTFLTFTMGSNAFAIIPEPTRSSDVPADLIWDTDRGCYISQDFEKDLQKEEPQIPTFDYSVIIRLIEKIKLNNSLFTDINKSPLEKALAEYEAEYMKNPSFKAYYDPKDDHALTILTKLGVKVLPDMMERIQSNPEKAGVLMYAVQEITSVKREQFIDASNQGRKAWLNEMNAVMKKAPTTVHENALQLENNPTDQTAVNNIINLGIFAAPFVMDEVAKGNTQVLVCMDKIAVAHNILTDKNIQSTWTDWTKIHENDLKVLQNMVEDAQ